MIRNLKVLGIAIGAVFAMSAMMATVASAQFEVEADHAFLEVWEAEAQEFAIKKGNSPVVCTDIDIDATVETNEDTTLTEITAEPTYSKCDNYIGQKVEVHTNGCHYLFHLAAEETEGTVDVECPEGEAIEITVGSICAYKIGSQTGLESVSYSNVGEGSTREVSLDPKVASITSTRTTSHFFCPAASNEGTYFGQVTVTAEDTLGGHVGVWVD